MIKLRVIFALNGIKCYICVFFKGKSLIYLIIKRY